MDPNETLEKLRTALAVLLVRRDRLEAIAPDDYKRDEIDELLDSVSALDAWLSKGGFLPDAWEPTESHAEPDPFPSSPRL